MKSNYDLIIIGAGAGGFASAIRANETGIKTLMVNEGLPLGGTCVNVGCVPSKRLQWAGYVKNLIENHGIKGLEAEIRKKDFRKVIEEEQELVKNMRNKKYEYVLDNLENVEFLKGKAKFVSKNEIEVNGEIFKGNKFIIAVGSTARIPEIKGIKETGFITHIEALKLEKIPSRMAVIGAGPLGLEFSQIFSRLGSEVIIFSKYNRVFPKGEREISLELENILKQEGIKVIKETEIVRTEKEGNSKVLIYKKDGELSSVEVDEILLAAGKIPNTKYLNPEIAGIKVDDRGRIIVNEYYQTENSNIYAVGDCINMPLRLETTAAREGTIAAENALLNRRRKLNYLEIPYTIFTDPPLSGVGYTEEEFVKKFKVCSCRSFYFEDLPKAIISNKTKGLIKMVMDPDTERIVGIHILGENSFELIYSASLIIKNKMTLDDVINTLPVFPSFSESIKLAAISFKKDVSKLSCCV